MPFLSLLVAASLILTGANNGLFLSTPGLGMSLISSLDSTICCSYMHTHTLCVASARLNIQAYSKPPADGLQQVNRSNAAFKTSNATNRRHAFAADSLLSLIYQIVQGKVPPLPPNAFSDHLADLIGRLLTRDPAKRPSLQEVSICVQACSTAVHGSWQRRSNHFPCYPTPACLPACPAAMQTLLHARHETPAANQDTQEKACKASVYKGRE